MHRNKKPPSGLRWDSILPRDPPNQRLPGVCWKPLSIVTVQSIQKRLVWSPSSKPLDLWYQANISTFFKERSLYSRVPGGHSTARVWTTCEVWQVPPSAGALILWVGSSLKFIFESWTPPRQSISITLELGGRSRIFVFILFCIQYFRWITLCELAMENTTL